jgi:hypothetical protein
MHHMSRLDFFVPLLNLYSDNQHYIPCKAKHENLELVALLWDPRPTLHHNHLSPHGLDGGLQCDFRAFYLIYK